MTTLLHTSRRSFLKTASAATLAFGATPLLAQKTDKKYTTALIGTGWWGMNILNAAVAGGRTKVVGMCDVDKNQLDPAVEHIVQTTGEKPKAYGDYRELLEELRPEIAIVATPDHWHPLITIAAIESGAHVYVEKPVGHTLLEGRAMVNAARKHGRTVQVGTHRRASPHNISGMEFLKSGKAGEIGMVRAFVHYPGGPGEVTPDSEPPEGLDWDMWCGPAPLVPFNSRMHPKGFRSFLNYANGQLGDWGIHWMDQILWSTEETYPKKVSSFGGRHILVDNTDAPDTQVATFEFDSFTATWEHRLYAGNNNEKHPLGCYFYGTKGVFHMGWLDGWTFYPDNGDAVIHEDPKLEEPDQQNIPQLWANFVHCIETGETPICDIEIGHRSTSMSLLGMLALKHGKSLEWDGEKERVVGDEAANALLRREYRSPWVYPEVS
jgi:predicted dehydrogenase